VLERVLDVIRTQPVRLDLQQVPFDPPESDHPASGLYHKCHLHKLHSHSIRALGRLGSRSASRRRDDGALRLRPYPAAALAGKERSDADARRPDGPRDELVVTDCNNGRLQRFDAEGRRLGGFALPWDDPKKASTQAGGILVDDAGRITVSFMSQHVVRVYAEDGALVREWGRKGAGQGEFNQPGGLAFSPDGALLVADQCNHRIQKFTRDGRFPASWGGHGTAPGRFGGPDPPGSRFAGPHFLSVDVDGRLYTTEGVSGRIQQLALDGKPLLSWGNKSDAPGGFGSLQTPYRGAGFGPIAVLAVRHGRIWVSSLNDRVQAFALYGRFLMGLGGTGKEPGRFFRPHGLAFDRAGHLYVVDSGNQRIQKFRIPAP
jgi:sugar lactone lactonase YvrE